MAIFHLIFPITGKWLNTIFDFWHSPAYTNRMIKTKKTIASISKKQLSYYLIVFPNIINGDNTSSQVK